MKYKYLIEAETWTGKWAGFLCKYEINVNVSAAMLLVSVMVVYL